MKKLILFASVLFLPVLFFSNAYAGEYTFQFKYAGKHNNITKNLSGYKNYRMVQYFRKGINNKYAIVFYVPKPWRYAGKKEDALFATAYCRQESQWDKAYFVRGGRTLKGGGVTIPLFSGKRLYTLSVGAYCGRNKIATLHTSYDRKTKGIDMVERIGKSGSEELKIFALTDNPYLFEVFQGNKVVYFHARHSNRIMKKMIKGK